MNHLQGPLFSVVLSAENWIHLRSTGWDQKNLLHVLKATVRSLFVVLPPTFHSNTSMS